MTARKLIPHLSALIFGAAALGAQAADAKFKMESPDLKNGTFSTQFVANGFGCKGENISPEIKWSNPPKGTKSFALMLHDPDAPTSVGGFLHWTVVNIPAAATGLAQGAGNSALKLPEPAVGAFNDFYDTGVGGNGNYGGPCPPAGDKAHRYVFTLYALAVENLYAAAGIPKTAGGAVHGFVLNKGLGDKLLGKASFIARYGR
jgi:Raf kinase inhibitor-like YbhB/YbcL family protein